ncbi:hypothetical protein XELAEV_18030165mg [Xenopus laevis]|uniref:Uncharacterized protein n=1 Tax=Xenopus laevis TaxID=8355 RepID=A0A974HIC0_XENLA|nr:hypothetical protein XELAEV_18030165mg [Xenopus laevis]
MEQIETLTKDITNRAETHSFSDNQINLILFKSSPLEAFGPDSPQDLTRDLERLKKKEQELHLHGVTLSEYYKQRLIPRGFRISNTPTTGRDNKEFCQKCCAILNKASLDLMVLVIEHTSHTLSKIRTDILKIELEFDRVSTQEERDNFCTQLNEKLDSFKTDLLLFKKKKLLKVVQDYKTDNVYRWLKGDNYNRRVRKFIPRQQDRGSSSGSVTELTDSDSPVERRQQKSFLARGTKAYTRKKPEEAPQKAKESNHTPQDSIPPTPKSPVKTRSKRDK